MTLTADERAAERIYRQAKARERKAAKVARPKSPKADRGRIREPGFLAFLRRQPCAVGPIGCDGPVEAAHIRYGLPGEPPTGLQRKPSDTRAVPLCRRHHREGPDSQHAANERVWWARHRIDPMRLAGELYVEYLRASPFPNSREVGS